MGRIAAIFGSTSLMEKLKYLRRVTALTMRNFYADNCLSNAASLTYTTLFAIVPLLTVLYSILALFPSFQGVGEDIQEFIFSNFVPDAGEVVSDWLTSFSHQARNLTFIGIGFLFVTALLMLRTVDYAINAIFHTVDSRRPVISLLLYWVILTLGPFLLGLGFAATSYLATLSFLNQAADNLGIKGTLLYILPSVMNMVVFTLLYVVVPKGRVLFVHALVGGIFVSTVSTAARIGFTYMMHISPTYEFIYGAFAAVPVFLLWIFLSWLVVLMGAELVHALGEPQILSGQVLSPMLAMIAILATINKRFESGEPTELVDVQTDGWVVNQHNWELVTEWLLLAGILGRNPSGAMVPARTFASVELAEVVHQCPWRFPANHELHDLNLSSYPYWFTELVKDFEAFNRICSEQLSGSLAQRLTDNKKNNNK